LGLSVAEYEAAGAFIKSRDFTDSARVDFEPASGIIGDESDYVKIFEMLRTFGESIAAQYVAMCYFDGLIFNMDRHENNFGILRDADTGEILSLAPLYDHNISLIARGYPASEPNDMLITDFAELLRHIGKAFKARKLSEPDVLTLVRGVPFAPPSTALVPDPREFNARYLLKRQAALSERCGDRLRLV
jgi:hypothetical protein